MFKHLKVIKFVLLGLLGIWMASAPSVAALTTNDIDSLIKQHPYYDSAVSSVCSTTSSSNLPGSDVPEKIWNYLISTVHLNKIAAAAIVGNIQHETDGTWDPRINNGGQLSDYPFSTSQAYGLVQWLDAGPNGGRQTNLVKKAAATGAGVIPGDLSIQLEFMKDELEGGFKKNVTDEINSPTATIESATKVVYDVYEGLKGSGQGSAAGRAPTALDIFNRYKDLSPGQSTISPNPACVNIYPSGECPVAAPVWGSQNGRGDQYSQSQLTSMLGDPGTFGSHPTMDANLVSVDFLGKSALVHKLVAPCLEEVAKEIQTSGSTYRVAQFGCYRWDRGQLEERSYHTYGIACDINESKNPIIEGLNLSPPCDYSGASYDIPPEFVAAFRNHGFTWGGNWCDPKDYMHFEFNGFDPNKPIPTTPVVSDAAKAIVKTALDLAWPDYGNGEIPTDSYKRANEIYNKENENNTDIRIKYGADCGVFVSVVMRMSGVDLGYPAGADDGTKRQENYLENNPNYQLIKPPPDGKPLPKSLLQPGDILLVNKGSGAGANGHTFIYLGAEGGQYNAAQASWSTAGFESSDMPYLKNITSLLHSTNGAYTIVRHK